MENQKLVEYVQTLLQQGKSKDEIKNSLSNSGWQDSDIEKVFTTLGQNNSQPNSFQNTSLQITSVEAGLPGVFDLIGEALALYKQRAGTFIGIMLVPFLFAPLFLIVSKFPKFYTNHFDESNKFLAGLFFLLMFSIVYVASAVFQIASQSALFYSIKGAQENISIVESYRRAFSTFFSYLWVLILVGFIIVGGFLLFIIPGIIFMTTFGFAAVILINENETGMNALLKSREYVRGMWWKIFRKLFSAGIIISLPFYGVLIPLYILKVPYFQIITTAVSTLFLLPLTFSVTFLLYQHVRVLKGEIVTDLNTSKKVPFVLVGLLTLIFIIGLFLISILGLHSALKKSEDKFLYGSIATSTVGMELTTYTNEEFAYSIAYPKTWDQEIQSNGSSTSVIFFEPSTGNNGLLRTIVEITTVNLSAPQDMETTVSNYKMALESNKATSDNQDTLLLNEPTTFMGFPAHKFISTKLRSFDNGKTYVKRKQKSILFTKGTTLFNVEYKKDMDFFDSREPLADSIIANIVIK